jgi:hypothetical protein
MKRTYRLVPAEQSGLDCPWNAFYVQLRNVEIGILGTVKDRWEIIRGIDNPACFSAVVLAHETVLSESTVPLDRQLEALA